MQSPCPRCGAELTVDATECPVCAYGEVEEIVILEARPAAAPHSPAAAPSGLPRVFAALAFLVVVIVVIFAILR